jgi:hypothetical protein
LAKLFVRNEEHVCNELDWCGNEFDKFKSINDGEIYSFAVPLGLNVSTLYLPSKLLFKVYVNETNYIQLVYSYQFRNVILIVTLAAFLGLLCCLFLITYHSKIFHFSFKLLTFMFSK